MADEKKKEVTTLEEANEAGYLGVVPDDTPNEAYTVAGVTSSDTAAEADRAAADKSPPATPAKAPAAKKSST